MIKKLLSAIDYILNECHKAPDDSVVDIANEAFEKEGINELLSAKWNEEVEDNPPVILTSNAYLKQPEPNLKSLLKRCLNRINESDHTIKSFMDIMKLIDEYAIYRSVRNDINNKFCRDKIQSRIYAMQEVCDAAVKFADESDLKPGQDCCTECDLLLVVEKNREALK